MNIKTYIEKSNTIIYNSEVNTGKNPVFELYYGGGYSRVLFKVDTEYIEKFINDKTFSNRDDIRHVIKLKNAWSLQSLSKNTLFNSGMDRSKERTSSFDLYLLRMPEDWDSGIGSDYTKDGFITSNYVYSENASNWFTASGNTYWKEGFGAISGTVDESHPYYINKQHFNQGSEDIEIDITNEINSIIYDNTPNNGFMLCFPTEFEQIEKSCPQYVGFLSNNSSTFFKPYIETIYNENIIDDRNDFFLGKTNRLYLYTIIGGSYCNLDELPTCTINDNTYTVIQATKGIYYVTIESSTNGIEEFEVNQMYYDVWSNIKYNGKILPDIEKEFVVKDEEIYFNLNDAQEASDRYVPSVYGIKLGAKINRGDIYKIYVDPRIEYTNKNVNNITGMEYRIYVKDASREFTVTDYEPINRALNSNFFLIDSNSLLPNKYFIDIRINMNDEKITYKSRLIFEVIEEM